MGDAFLRATATFLNTAVPDWNVSVFKTIDFLAN
jgi:hypothetical protein